MLNKMDSLLSIINVLNDQMKNISNNVVNLKTLTSILEARTNNIPLSFMIKPKPQIGASIPDIKGLSSDVRADYLVSLTCTILNN
jgi:hypothetical protein